MSAIRRWLANAALVVLSITLTALALEGVARLVLEPRTSGANLGILHRTFQEKHGRTHGLQPGVPDLAGDHHGTSEAILFIGDSLTNGHGVMAHESFPARVEQALGGHYVVHNLGVNGENTRQELDRLSAALDRVRSPVAFVVHQYVGNDIDDLTILDITPAGGWLGPLLVASAERSYLVDYLYHPFFMNAIGEGPVRELLAAYADEEVRAAHLHDLRALWGKAHGAGSSVIFVVFPFTFNPTFFDLSREAYVTPLVRAFHRTCSKGDAVLDVAELMSTHSGAGAFDDWVVNPVDAHPSARLHGLVGKEIAAFVRSGTGRAEPCAGRSELSVGPTAPPVAPAPSAPLHIRPNRVPDIASALRARVPD